jgi:hypothetical protein
MKELRIVLLCLCVANCISCHSKQMKQANQNTSQLNQEDISAVFNNRLIINSISPNHMDVTDSDYSINKLALFADNALENIHDGHWIKDTTDGRLVYDKFIYGQSYVEVSHKWGIIYALIKDRQPGMLQDKIHIGDTREKIFQNYYGLYSPELNDIDTITFSGPMSGLYINLIFSKNELKCFEYNNRPD